MFLRESSETIGRIHPDAADAAQALREAATRVLASGTSGTFVPALLGTTFQTTTMPVIYADYLTLYLPGLRGGGAEAEIVLLPARTEELVLAPGQPIPVCGFHGEPFTDAPDEDDGEKAAWSVQALGPQAEIERAHVRTVSAGAESRGVDDTRLDEIDRGRTLERCGLLRNVSRGSLEWTDSAGGMQNDTEAAFLQRFSRYVRITGRVRPLSRRSAVIMSVRRATLFALAYPDRFLTGTDADTAAREDAAAFLAEAAGDRRDPLSLRWRQAAQCLTEADVPAALDRLYDATLRSMHLPAEIYGALCGPADSAISKVEMHELVYLARAGSRDLKVLATVRLAQFGRLRPVRQTLEQLSVSNDPLVRAAAATALHGRAVAASPRAD